MVEAITKKITGYKVKDNTPQEANEPVIQKDELHEKMPRPEMLRGSTYKIKNPQSEHAMYVTINDIILNAGTEHEERRPYEVFINSKNMDHHQWVVALTRLMSAVFRKGGDVEFLVEELKAVFDPKGGFWLKGTFVPSIVAQIGHTIEAHLKATGVIKVQGLDEHQKAFIEAKKAEFEAKNENSGKDKMLLCSKCNAKAVIIMDGCSVCTECLESKCG